MRNPPILIAVLGFFAALAGFGYLFFGLRVIGFDWFGALGDLPAVEHFGLWGWLAVIVGVIWLAAAFGLWALQPWARLFAMIIAGFSLFEAVLAMFSAPGTGIGLGMAILPLLILWYLNTAEVKAAFLIPTAEAAPAPTDAITPTPAPVAPAPVAAPALAAAGAGSGVAAAVALDTPAAPVAAAAPVVAPAAAASLKIEDVEGIGPAYGAKLAEAGIATTDELLHAGATRHGRQQLAEATGISEHLLLEWVNNADLMRIPGVGTQYSDLLEAAGVDSPAELAQRNAANLATTFQEVVAARPGTVRRVPSEAEVAGWIDEARRLPKIVEH